ncbi:SDR family oxidoreductase [Magnetospirillum sp. 15-1]|uniref:SDR family oxidoreductase n=1 Tax=Magnetospirillum sp. 15-1 TaxID=1979370 RepID=UPI000BBBD68D|nr:SDR family oxidoreductase [Magnetospirillum sp. 15-1]
MTYTVRFGFTDEELAAYESSFRPGLFDGKAVLISGGGSGLGKAMAWLFARLGGKVAIVGRDLAKLESVCAAMGKAGLKAEHFVCNIRKPEDVDALMSKVTEALGGLDVLVNSAGGQFPQAAMDFSAKGWNAVVDTNLNGTWYMMQAAGRYWRDSGKPGSIVNIVTVVDRGQPGVAHTCAARAGVVALTKTVAVEWAPYNIRVNCVAPGAIDTEGQRVYTEEARQRSARGNPMMRFGDSFDIAEAAVYLSAPSGKFITGQTLTVDGGGVLWGEFWVADKPDYFK